MLALFSLIALVSAAAIPTGPSQGPATNITTSSLNCPVDIKGNFEFPHLIIPTSKENPQEAPGTSFWAEISSKKTTVFNFDIRASPEYKDKTCALIFMFPYKSTPPTYEWSGMEAQEYSKGGLIFSRLLAPANPATTYANIPAVDVTYDKIYLIPGSTHHIATFPCNAGGQETFSGASVGIDDLKFFQHQAESGPQGLFVVPCL